jgi:hypothetical protein
MRNGFAPMEIGVCILTTSVLQHDSFNFAKKEYDNFLKNIFLLLANLNPCYPYDLI